MGEYSSPLLLVFLAWNHSGLVRMVDADVPRIPEAEKSPRVEVLMMLARVWASALTGLTPSTVVSIKHTSMLRLLWAVSLPPARSLLPKPGVMAPRVITPREIAPSCTSFTLKRTTAPLPFVPPLSKSSSAQDVTDNAAPLAKSAEQA